MSKITTMALLTEHNESVCKMSPALSVYRLKYSEIKKNGILDFALKEKDQEQMLSGRGKSP